MPLSRRNFLGTLALSTAAVTFRNPLEAAQRAAAPTPPPRPGGEILLNSNENPYGPFPGAMASLRESLEYSNRYPWIQYDDFVEHVAWYHGVQEKQILLGCGSSEILRMSVDAFCGRDRKLLVAHPTFELCEHYARRIGVPVVEVPLTREWAHDVEAMVAKADEHTGLVYICNPNNPTASLTPRADLDALLSKLPPHVHVLMDEAYHHFVESPQYRSYLEKAPDNPRVMVARTFSKVYGMAGLRLGYVVAAPAMIEQLERVQLPDNVNMLVLACALEALDDGKALEAAVQRNERDRAEFLKQAQQRKLACVPPQANFVMMHAQRPCREVIAHCKKHNVLIGRPFPPMDDYVRISLGLPEEMQRFWGVWDQMS